MIVTLLPAIALILAVGCSPKQEPEDVPEPPKAPAAQESAKDVVTGYGQGLSSSLDKAKKVQVHMDINEIQRGVQQYTVDNGARPQSLDDVAPYIAGEIDFSPFEYDPDTGKVTAK